MKPTLPNMLNGKLYGGQVPVPEAASLMWFGSMVKIVGSTVTLDVPVAKLRVSPRIGTTDRFVALPDGKQFQCPDSPLLDRLPQEDKTEGGVAWLEQRWYVALLSVVVTLASVGLGYFIGLPAAAKHLAARVPIEYEIKLGEQAMEWFDERELLAPSQLNDDVRTEITEGFNELTADLPMQAHYRLEFRDAPEIGPNAFALPGGVIVLTDQMVHKCESLEEVLAILAHEVGHTERRHLLRHVLQDSAVAALVASVTSDVASLSAVVAGLPAVLAQTKYSRDFETEADDFAFDLLKQHKRSPASFAAIMERLRKEKEIDDVDGALSFLSTHPMTKERIARARKAAIANE